MVDGLNNLRRLEAHRTELGPTEFAELLTQAAGAEGFREYGVAMACRITELVLDCRNPEVLADFWCQVLGFVVLETGEDGSVEIGPAGTDPDDPGLTLVFDRSTQPKQAKLRLHFDVNSVDRTQDEELQRLLGLGARKADVGQTGEESWHVLADPEGNEFCLLRRTVRPASSG
jgi:catechol 2,3-dioxygenase-like lactoylglutathione lyase family enzyme